MVCVSVILPTYNRAHCLVASIRSVLSQSFTDIELILVDDCSTDGTEDLVRSIDDDRLRYLRRETNGGAAAARNTGIAAATGRFIAFQDSDDYWLPGKLEMQLRIMHAAMPNVGVVTGAKLYWNGTTSKIAPDPASSLSLEEDQYGHLLTENRVSVQNALFRRECLADPNWFDARARANEDWGLAVRLARRWKILEHADIVVLAVLSPDSISRNRRPQDLGMLRMMKANAAMRHQYPRQFASLVFDLGRYRWGPGKRRSSLRLMAAGIAAHPFLLGSIGATVLRRRLRYQAMRIVQTI